ncbi:thiamine pyrophosphate-dependent enzyme [Methanorbis rubei]|uniref:Thiamine pyrophosphate enzyme TPP-binding domain-containing protein n=1 Tax=Methanorbis rubei TaxID=3028300 RepID=A0AAE4MG78_9EURY|nr:hypothetical protein [Methanocorpusculaceae archaeon Cs1]
MARSLDILSAAIHQASDTRYAVPGYPVTELAELCGAEYTINEKVALEYALGDSLSGRRSVVIVKNAGMNTLSDPLVTATVQGVRAGVVIVAGDDIELSASQTRQNSCIFGDLADVPIFEPNADELHSIVESAMEKSETYSRVAVIRIASPILQRETEWQTLPTRRPSPANEFPKDLTTKGMCEHAENVTAKMRGEKNYQQKIPKSYEHAGSITTFCRHCPYKPLLSLLKENNQKIIVDTGCSLLARKPPYTLSLANYGLGSSPAVAAKSTGVALCGDYAVLHSGLNALIDIAEKGHPLLCIILQNRTLAMTGGQKCPDITRYLSCFHPRTISADEIEELEKELKSEQNGLKILIVSGTCPKEEHHEIIPY